jgi:hypothetical protein
MTSGAILKNAPHFVLTVLVATWAAQIWIAEGSETDPKSLGHPFAVLLAVVAAGIASASPWACGSRYRAVCWLREVPMGCLVAVAIWICLLLSLNILPNPGPLPRWAWQVIFLGITLIALACGVVSVIRQVRHQVRDQDIGRAVQAESPASDATPAPSPDGRGGTPPAG